MSSNNTKLKEVEKFIESNFDKIFHEEIFRNLNPEKIDIYYDTINNKNNNIEKKKNINR